MGIRDEEETDTELDIDLWNAENLVLANGLSIK
jgi:hypothetical protein